MKYTGFEDLGPGELAAQQARRAEEEYFARRYFAINRAQSTDQQQEEQNAFTPQTVMGARIPKPFGGSKTDFLPSDAKARKDAPIARGVLDYFPLAVFAVAELSRVGNEQHNPGQPMHWAREKSTDHADCIVRHLIDRGKFDSDGQRHSAKVAWRALALLQTELEEELKNA